jgi:glycosyltransferase involved in cell wall biosynthesis
VIPNALNRSQIATAAEVAATPRMADGHIRIGYFSGSRTHQRDFAVCEAVLLDIMAQNSNVRFRLVGHLDLAPHWQRFADRIERIGLLTPEALLRSIAEVDINLAPLETGNPFCEAKSELKFFEAAVVGVPTVASATEPFATAIEDGVSGYIARDLADWRHVLELLTDSEDRRKAMGKAARARALARYSPTATFEHAVAALQLGAPVSHAASAASVFS